LTDFKPKFKFKSIWLGDFEREVDQPSLAGGLQTEEYQPEIFLGKEMAKVECEVHRKILQPKPNVSPKLVARAD
jgi:hypothetical protein